MGVGTYEGRVVPELVRSLAFMRTWKSQCDYRVVSRSVVEMREERKALKSLNKEA